MPDSAGPRTIRLKYFLVRGDCFSGIEENEGEMVSRKVPAEKTATREELDRAVPALTDVDLVRLERFAKQRIARIGGAADVRDHMDLLGEAYRLTYEGHRSWNKDVSLLVHLFRTIRSVSSHWAETFATEREQGRDLIST